MGTGSSSSFRVRGAAAVVLLGGFLFAACNAISGVGDLTFGAGGTGGSGGAGPCSAPAECPDPKNECLVRTCTEGKCGTASVPDGTATDTQTAGDCKVTKCAGGKASDVDDDTDVPTTATDCDDEVCTAGVASNPPKAAGSFCNTAGGKVCDGNGLCVPCNVDADCVGTTDDCQHPKCTDHACAPEFTTAGTALGTQTTGDCQTKICDGNGGTMTVADDSDLPGDGNDCTDDTCAAGVPGHANRPAGSTCGNNLACDANGQCTGCTLDAQCTAPQTCGGGNPGTPNVCGCTPKTCAQLGVTCGSVSDGCSGTLNCDDGKSAGETDVDCGGASSKCSTRCGQAMACSVTTDCQLGLFCVDGICCGTPCNGLCLACSNAKTGQPDGQCGPVLDGTDPDNECTDTGAGSCQTDGMCDGTGQCRKYPNGTVCVPPSCAGSTYSKPDTCLNGACIDNLTVSCGTFACTPTGCAQSCAVDTDCQSGFYCTAPTCTLKKSQGQGCSANNQCTTGSCADGVCCENACSGTCKACNLAGSIGKCVNIPKSPEAPDPNGVPVCAVGSACDGGGVCKKARGTACMLGSECASGACADGVCCDSTCGSACSSCTVAGHVGTCFPVAKNSTDTNPANACVAPKACDGAGACKQTVGQACGVNADCVNGQCVDGVCCNSPSCAGCQACNIAGSVGTCKNVPQLSADPDVGCAGSLACDGTGACLTAPGFPCSTSSNCASHVCSGSFVKFCN